MNNKVYINPNFNNPPKNLSRIQNSKLHVNQNFPEFVQNKNKIYVNPNFVKANPNHEQYLNNTVYSHNLNKSIAQSVMASSSTNTRLESNVAATKSLTNTTQLSVSKSRYSLVRQVAKVLTNQENIKPKATVQINKYKSVALSQYKISLDNSKISQKIVNEPSCSFKKDQKTAICSDNSFTKITSQFRPNQIKHDSTKMFKDSKFVYRKNYIDSSRNIVKTRQVKLKLVKRNLKKNNIPCPLFKKYGKCIRITQGKCGFLHDKKHVSICRKFVKGICHENDCLLSHDITSNKMPTCYFYLKGVCTRDSCPYLHVKLNDKTKICTEFLKGYCEKGDECLNRHVRLQKVVNKKSSPNSLKSPCVGIYKSNNTINSNDVYEGKQSKKGSSNILNNKIELTDSAKSAETAISNEGRYYKDVVTPAEEDNESTEVLKPTRCKLGTLPSFIKF